MIFDTECIKDKNKVYLRLSHSIYLEVAQLNDSSLSKTAREEGSDTNRHIFFILPAEPLYGWKQYVNNSRRYLETKTRDDNYHSQQD